jgi:hypothetical protein
LPGPTEEEAGRGIRIPIRLVMRDDPARRVVREQGVDLDVHQLQVGQA